MRYSYILCSDVEAYTEQPEIPTTPQTITDKNGTGITVNGDLPEGVTLEVTEIPREDVSLIVDTNLYPMGTTVKAYDIKLVMPDGSEYDPNGYVTIKITKEHFKEFERSFNNRISTYQAFTPVRYQQNGKMLEINITDLHLGKFACTSETGGIYNTSMAKEAFFYIINDFCKTTRNHDNR